MTDIVLTPVTSGYNLARINANFAKVQDTINNDIIHNVGGNNVMHQSLDMNFNHILNIFTDVNDPGSLLTIEAADARYYNIAGDTLLGPMNAGDQHVTNLPAPIGPTEPARKLELDQEVYARAAADASIQDQLLGVNPPMGSAFSILSWHDQVITNSITIPPNKNAWSFGPTITLGLGQVVTIGVDSFWTIANGATTGDGSLVNEIPDPLDFGDL